MILGLAISSAAIGWIVFVYVNGPSATYGEKVKAANRRLG